MARTIEFIDGGKVEMNVGLYHELMRDITFLRDMEFKTRNETSLAKERIESLERENERLYNILSQVTKTDV